MTLPLHPGRTPVYSRHYIAQTPPWLPLTQGSIWHVKPSTGSDGNNGTDPANAFATLPAALSAATANQNDIVLFYGEGNAAASCTSYVLDADDTLDWNKDLVHLIGVNSGVNVSPRARVSLESGFDNASNLFTLSANGCYVANIQFYSGVASANVTGCMQVTGDRNRLENCHIAGIGNNANDIAGAYSVKLTGDENLFIGCTIGLDSIAAGTAANSDLLVDTGATRNSFVDCDFVRMIEHASNFAFVQLADATAIDRYLRFFRCSFTPFATNYATTLAAVMKVPTLTQGFIQVWDCAAFTSDNGSAIKWDANDSNKIQIVGTAILSADTGMQGFAV